MRTFTIAFICAAFIAAAVASTLGPSAVQTDVAGDERVARMMGETTNPVAVISPMPDMISNGTYYFLDGTQSYDMDDDLVDRTTTIINYTWQITFGDEVSYLYGASDRYWFWDQGLYKIKLTVRDIWGNEGVDFTAVISVDDSDFDGLPDWWEMAYFDSLEQGPSDDPDGDGYTNLQEFADGTDPTVPDPPPARAGFIEEYWEYIALAGAVAAAAVLGTYPMRRRRRKALEQKKIKYAIEIEKSLDDE